MKNNLLTRLKQGWNIMRIIRLGLATVVIVEAFKNSELIFGLLGGLLLFQAAFNYGCCGTTGCDINHTSKEHQSLHEATKDITFEEIK